MSSRRLEHDPRQVVDRVEDTVAGDLCKYIQGSSNRLVDPLPHLVQQFLPRLVQGQFRPYSGVVRGVAVFDAVAPYRVVHVVFLADGDGPFLTIAGDADAEDLRKSLHDESTLIGTARLNFQHLPGANNLVSRRD